MNQIQNRYQDGRLGRGAHANYGRLWRALIQTQAAGSGFGFCLTLRLPELVAVNNLNFSSGAKLDLSPDIG